VHESNVPSQIRLAGSRRFSVAPGGEGDERLVDADAPTAQSAKDFVLSLHRDLMVRVARSLAPRIRSWYGRVCGFD
jgi:hypothetical protein